jgi:hypothetical protein
MYHLLTGDTPFSDPMPMNTMLSHVNDVPRPPSQLNPAISPRLDALIMSALEKSPNDRPESARAFRAALLALPEAKGLRPDSSPKLEPVTLVGVSTAPSTRSAPPPMTLPYSESTPVEAPPRRSRIAFWIGVAAVVVVGATLWATGAFTPSPSSEGIEVVASASSTPPGAPAPAPAPAVLTEPAAPEKPAPAEVLAKAPEAGPADSALAAKPAASDLMPTALEMVAPQDTTSDTSAAAAATAPPNAPDAAPAHLPVTQTMAATSPARNDPKAKRPTPADKVADADAASPKTSAPKAPVTQPTEPPPTVVANVDPPKTADTKAPPVAPEHVAPTRPPSLSAAASIGALQSRGSLPRSALARAIDGARPGIEDCYTTAARAANRDLGGQLAAALVFDVDGKVTSVNLGSFGLPGLTSCVNSVLWKTRLRERPDTGSVDASFRIVFTPR